MTTLKDIGEELGLSVATVSRALNGFPEVSVRTRDRVHAAAERLGYRPNRIAQRLVTGRSGMVGMIMRLKPDFSADLSVFEILTRLTAALASRDTDLVFAVDTGTDLVEPYARILQRGILDGFILNAPVPDDPRISYLTGRGIPFVVHGQAGADPDYPFFGIDNRAVSVDAADLLLALGHRRIALLNGEPEMAYARDRAEGFAAAMAAEGLSVPAPFLASGEVSERRGYTTGLSWLSGRDGPRPTAIVCGSSLLAAGVLRAARDLRLEVPRDLSVVAHDDAQPLFDPAAFDPPLTVTRAPLADACGPLADHLVARIAGAPGRSLQTLVRAELVVRRSTSPSAEGGDAPWAST